MGSKLKKGKHPVIGILAGSFHSDFSRMIVTEIATRLKERGAEIHLYLGMDVARYLEDYTEQEDIMSLQYFSLFAYSNFDDLDLLIISSDTIYAAEYGVELEDFLRKLPKVPKVIIGESIENDTEISVMIDQYDGVKTMVDHLIEEHGCKKIAFLTGPKNIPNALTRLSAYRDSLKLHGLEVDEELIEYGNFTSLCDKQVEKLLSHKPEAIAAANDEMTVAIYRVAKKLGLEIGRDLLVTGYDDIPVAKIMEPPLTTMRQDYDRVADAAVDKAYEFLETGKSGSAVIKAYKIIRGSCGCAVNENDNIRRNEKRGLMLSASYEELKMREIREMKATLLLRSLLVQPITIKDFLERLAKGLVMIGVDESMFTLLDEPEVMDENKQMFAPEYQRLVMVQNPAGNHVFDPEDAPKLFSNHEHESGDSRDNIQHIFPGKIWSTYMLFHDNLQYGSWSVKLELSDFMFYYTISLEIGSALRYLFLALEQQKTRKKLEEQNLALDYSASHDELTGIYNRIGLLNRIKEFLGDEPYGKSYVAVMSDLDHLKQINDNFGHGEGDYAIKTSAAILRKAMPQGMPLGRTGGDEFMGIFVADGSFCEEDFIAGVKKLCEEENKNNGRKYYVNLSVGCYTFRREADTDTDFCFRQADVNLYEAKKDRLESVVR